MPAPAIPFFCLMFSQGLKKARFAFLSALKGRRGGGGGGRGNCHSGDSREGRCFLALFSTAAVVQTAS